MLVSGTLDSKQIGGDRQLRHLTRRLTVPSLPLHCPFFAPSLSRRTWYCGLLGTKELPADQSDCNTNASFQFLDSISHWYRGSAGYGERCCLPTRMLQTYKIGFEIISLVGGRLDLEGLGADQQLAFHCPFSAPSLSLLTWYCGSLGTGRAVGYQPMRSKFS